MFISNGELYGHIRTLAFRGLIRQDGERARERERKIDISH